MKPLIGLAFLVAGIVFFPLHAAYGDTETTLDDSDGTPVAYVADDMTIFTWSGKPVAYLDGKGGPDVIDIYGFNGKHLGWFSKGVIYDHDGNTTGAIPSLFTTPTKLEEIKGLKALEPLKALEELPPLKPLFSKTWSSTPLMIFLNAGASDGSF